MRRFSRLRKVSRRVGLGALVLLCFVLSTLLGVRLHLNLPHSRELIRSEVNRLMATTFQGHLEITRLQHISLDGVRGVDGFVTAPETDTEQDPSLRFWDTSASISLGRLLSSLWSGGPIDVHLESVRVGAVHTRLATNAAGELNLARAFSPPPQTPPTPGGPSRGVRVQIDRVAVESSWTHGAISGSPPLDVDLNGLNAEFSYIDEQLELELLDGQLRARNLPEGIDPRGEVQGTLALSPLAELDASISFDGEVMQSPVKLSARYAPKGVRFELQSTRIARATLARYGLEPRGSVRTLQLSGEGPLSDIRFRGAIQLGDSEVSLSGKAAALAPRVEVKARLSKVDLRNVRKDLPKSSVDGQVEVEFELEDSAPLVHARLVLAPATVAGWNVPALHGEARLEDTRAHAFIRTAPGKTSVSANAQLDLAKPEQGIAFDAHVGVQELADLQQYAQLPAVTGDLRADACGTFFPEQQRVEAGAAVKSGRLRAAGFELEGAEVAADVQGRVENPHFSARLRAKTLRSEDGQLAKVIDFAKLQATAKGSPDALRVSTELTPRAGGRAPAVKLRAHLAPSRELVTRVEASLQHADRRVELTVASVRLGEPLEIRGANLSGAGNLRGDLVWSPTRLESNLQLDRVDLRALSVLLEGLPALDPPLSGIIDGRVELAGSASSPRGSIDVEIQQARRGDDSFSGEAHLVASEGQLTGRIQLHAARIGSVALTPRDVAPQGAWTDPEAWLAASGELRSDFAVDSKPLLERLGQAQPVTGFLRGNVEITRPDPAPRGAPAERLPTVRASWSTVDLELGPEKPREKPLLSGLDVRGELRADGETGETRVAVEALRGATQLARLEANSRVPYSRWLRQGEVTRDELLRHPLNAQLTSSNLPLAALPAIARMPGVDGRLDLEAKLQGSAMKPDLKIEFRGERLNIDELSRRRGLSSVGYVEYRNGVAKLRLGLSSALRSLVRAQAELKLEVSDALRGDLSAARADGELVVDEFALAALPVLRAHEVRGRASGRLELKDVGGANPKVNLLVKLPRGRVGEARFEDVAVKADLTRTKASASVLMQQPDGFGQALGSAAIRWKGLLPSLERGARIRLLANGWRLQALEPFVHEQVDRLDGRVDADARLDLIPGATKLAGFVRVREGVLQVPALGQQLKNLEAHVDLAPSGNVRLSGGSVEGLSGRAYFAAAAKLDGLSLVAANAKLRIPEKEAMPLTYQGVPLGDGSGAIDLKARLTPKQTRLDVDVRRFAFQLPRQPNTGVQNLEPDPHIRMGAQTPGGFVPILGPAAEEAPKETSQGAPTLVSIDLGDRFEVTQGTKLRVRLSGKLLIDSSRKQPVQGQIRLDGGRIDISGKLFEIEQGVISFGDDPSNPIVVARAAWDSPAGYKVIAEYAGPLKNGNFKLRAEPSLSQNEIVSLILFGTPEGSVGSGGGDGPGAASAAGVGAGVATAPLNRAIADVTDLDISTRVDTSSAQSPRPELVVQLSPRVSAQVGYNLEEPKPGKAPDRTLFTLEFRIASRWSLATTFGDGGSSLVDLVWRYRY